jgi:anaerobic magnesium-protoporphyrin IX monomethyl ester cyclase
VKVLLIQPPHFFEAQRRPPDYFPIGLGYMAKSLSKSGHDVEVLDIWGHEYTNEQVVQRIKQTNWDVAGISALSTQYAYTKWLAAELKRCNTKRVVVGGPLATLSPEIVLRNTEIDICVIGEGEVTGKEILANLDKLESVRGIYFKQDGEIIKNPPQEYIQDLDSIEFPAWDLFPTEVYIKNSALPGHPKMKVVRVISTRGCPYSCRYCSKPFTGIRFRSAANIADEIKAFVVRYPQVKGVNFPDDLLALNKRRMYELCDMMEPLNMKWACQARVDLVDLALLKRMEKSGCVTIAYGIESGSQTILDNMNKRVTVEQAEKALKETVDAGMWPRIAMMFGYPGETRETLRETIDFLKRLPYLPMDAISALRFSRTTPLPGTILYDQTIKQGLIGDEEKYLANLSTGGYMPGGTPAGVNLTNFTEKEFYQLKRKTEREIFWNNIRRHPLSFATDYPRYLYGRIVIDLSKVVPYLRKYGFRQMFRRSVERLKRIVLIQR